MNTVKTSTHRHYLPLSPFVLHVAVFDSYSQSGSLQKVPLLLVLMMPRHGEYDPVWSSGEACGLEQGPHATYTRCDIPI